MPLIFLARFWPRPGWAQGGGVCHGLAHAGVSHAVREAQGLPPGDAPPILHERLGAGAWRCWRGRWEGGEEEVRMGSRASAPPPRGRRVCRQPLGTGRTVAVCTAPKSAPALSGFAGSAFQRPVFLTARCGPHQTLAPGLRTLLPHAPQPGSRAPTPASALTPGDGPEGLRPPSDSALVLRVCVYTRERVHMCVRACEGSGAHV